MRPGYCAKWIEFKLIQLSDHADIISYMRARFLKPTIDNENPRCRVGPPGNENFNDQDLAHEQKQIELNIVKNRRIAEEQRMAEDEEEMRRAVQESNMRNNLHPHMQEMDDLPFD